MADRCPSRRKGRRCNRDDGHEELWHRDHYVEWNADGLTRAEVNAGHAAAGTLPPLSTRRTLHPMTPTIGRIVIYRSKIDNGPGNDVVSPAVVLRTRATSVPAVIDRWGPEPHTVTSASDPDVTHETTARPDGVLSELPDDRTVDLLVHGLGRDYREYAVTEGTGRGEWSWPERV